MADIIEFKTDKELASLIEHTRMELNKLLTLAQRQGLEVQVSGKERVHIVIKRKYLG